MSSPDVTGGLQQRQVVKGAGDELAHDDPVPPAPGQARDGKRRREELPGRNVERKGFKGTRKEQGGVVTRVEERGGREDERPQCCLVEGAEERPELLGVWRARSWKALGT